MKVTELAKALRSRIPGARITVRNDEEENVVRITASLNSRMVFCRVSANLPLDILTNNLRERLGTQ